MSFKNLIFIFYIWVPKTTIEGTMKRCKVNNTFYYFEEYDHNNYGFSILENSIPYTWLCLFPRGSKFIHKGWYGFQKFFI